MKRIFLTFIFSLILFPTNSEGTHRRELESENLNQSLTRMDEIVSQSSRYCRYKEKTIQSIKSRLKQDDTPSKRFSIYMDLFKEYKSYQTDSAINYIKKCITYSHIMNDFSKMEDCYALLALQCSRSGLYSEALDYLHEIRIHDLDKQGRRDYYYAANHLYGELSSYTSIEDKRKIYQKLADKYCDSLYKVCDKNDDVYLMKREMACTRAHQYDKALEWNNIRLAQSNRESHQYGVVAYYRYLIFEGMHQENEALYWLIEAACNDIENATTDQAALWTLADRLRDSSKSYYKESNLKRSYKYVTLAWEYARLFGGRARNWQISPILNNISSSFQDQTQSHNRLLKTIVVMITLFSFFTLGLILYVLSQNKKLNKAHRDLNTKNRLLNDANERLKVLTEQQQKTLDDLNMSNEKLLESNTMKDEYLGQFLTLCSNYIEQSEKLRAKVNRLARNEQKNELLKLTSGVEWEKQATSKLFQQFDQAFLHLFPNFIHDFNLLIDENYRFEELQIGDKLPTPIRVFALIRLGITDSKAIAKSLNYSVSTVYNYRVRYRNLALGDRNAFEQKVKEIGMAGINHEA